MSLTFVLLQSAGLRESHSGLCLQHEAVQRHLQHLGSFGSLLLHDIHHLASTPDSPMVVVGGGGVAGSGGGGREEGAHSAASVSSDSWHCFCPSAHPDVDPEPQIDEKSITHGCFKFRHSDLALIFSQVAIRGMFPLACVDPGQ